VPESQEGSPEIQEGQPVRGAVGAEIRADATGVEAAAAEFRSGWRVLQAAVGVLGPPSPLLGSPVLVLSTPR
jgi:hypothetical protein